MKTPDVKFILLANYRPDKQESMLRFANSLRDSLSARQLAVEIWYPTVLFGLLSKNTHAGLGKWLTYIDKYLIFPVLLWFKRRLVADVPGQQTFFHVCDHSNAPYLAYLPADRSGITCHDVLAIRAAFGVEAASKLPSATGRILQRWIFTHLSRVKILAAVSQTSLRQLLEICKNVPPAPARWKVIYNTFNAAFRPVESIAGRQLLEKMGMPANRPFMLTVGSDEERKNRIMLLDMAHALKGRWEGLICYAGHPLSPFLRSYAKELGLQGRLINIVSPDHESLVALYSACTAFVFPSFAEGFGWPLIEAQACGAPVITSNREPMLEITNAAALYADPYSPRSFADAFLQVLQPEKRSKLVALGFENAERFDQERMLNEFLDLYGIAVKIPEILTA